MATDTVYASTTAPNAKASFFQVPSENLEMIRFLVKVGEVLLSLVAFVLEEVVDSCVSCSTLYFFEFVSCTAFLFTLLLLILLSTSLQHKVGITCWPKVDFLYTALITVLFFIASIVFASTNGGTALEQSAVAFGFLGSIFFLADVGLFLRTRGSPFKSGGRPSSNGVSAPAAEREPMKADGTA